MSLIIDSSHIVHLNCFDFVHWKRETKIVVVYKHLGDSSFIIATRTTTCTVSIFLNVDMYE